MTTPPCAEAERIRETAVPVDYERYFSKSAARRRPAALRQTAVYMHKDGYIKMGGGFPNPLTFPVLKAHFTLRDGSVVEMDEKQMLTYQQYAMSEGYPELRQWLIEFQRRVHSPPTFDPSHPGQFDLIITNGANEGINLALEMLVEEGGWALCEEATYSSALSMMAPHAASFHGVTADREGMVTEDLVRVLTTWDLLHPGTAKPKVLYAVTSGGNPTGVTWSLKRRREVYAVARSHDLIILEDDAYYFLQFSRPLVPSFLSMDTDGRVLRFDTFTKLVAPGLRVAMSSGPAPLLRKMRLQKDVGSLTASGLSQGMLVQLLRHWGHDGFLRHVDGVMEFYKQKAQTVTRCAERHLAGLVEWNTPSGGMFLWLRVLGVKDSEVIVQKALERHVIFVAGTHFMPSNQKSAYIRVSFGTISEEDCEKGFTILADVIREELSQQHIE